MGFPTPLRRCAHFCRRRSTHLNGPGFRVQLSAAAVRPTLEAHLIPELTEYRVGEYIVGGEGHLRAGRHTVEECALRVLATVVSRPTEGRAILDSGSKTMSASTIPVGDGQSMGFIVEYPDARFYGASEEHGHVDVTACVRKPQIGERVQVLPVHPCPCVNEHNEIALTARASGSCMACACTRQGSVSPGAMARDMTRIGAATVVALRNRFDLMIYRHVR